MLYTRNEVIRAYLEDAEAVLANPTDSNRTKLAHRDRLTARALSTLPENVRLACNCTTIDPRKLNAGEIAECVLAYHYHDKAVEVLAPAGGTCDIITREGVAVEVKTSYNGSCYNKKMTRPMLLWLVNADGVYQVPAETAWLMTCTLRGGILPQKHETVMAWEGVKRLDDLSRAMGYPDEIPAPRKGRGRKG
jgi:hypothetical protein